MKPRDTPGETDTERLAIAEGKRMARKVFEKRGNHSEVHLGEEELSTLLAAVYEIAAAPNLLEACVRLLHLCAEQGIKDSAMDNGWKAVEKARGQ